VGGGRFFVGARIAMIGPRVGWVARATQTGSPGWWPMCSRAWSGRATTRLLPDWKIRLIVGMIGSPEDVELVVVGELVEFHKDAAVDVSPVGETGLG
jgi:hypothetical protein